MERMVARELCASGGGTGRTQLRITGGEPLVRKNLAMLVYKLASIDGIEDLALTTNGVLLTEQAEFQC